MTNFEYYKQYYNILNVSYDSDINYIKKSFRTLSLKYHPDKCNNNSVDYNKIIDAYEKLSNLFEKNSYNDIISGLNFKKSKNTDETNDSENSHYSQNYEQSDNSQKFKKYQSSKILTESFFQNFNNHNNYNKFLSNIETTIDITFENSYFGKSIPIQINRNIFKNNVISNEIETLYIEIPVGIDNNEIININNKGNIYNDSQSDIKIKINLIFHPLFTRNGLDIIYTIDISLKESLIGFEKIFKHINNKSYKISNTNGDIINNNYYQKLDKLGFTRNNFIGDFIIKFNIDYSIKLSQETKKQLAEIL
tara:strand:- start:306 stop:1226 length:921 start_codon:yes stop_codon:yes gene_type:complete